MPSFSMGFGVLFVLAAFCFVVRKAKLNSFKFDCFHVWLPKVQKVLSVRRWCWKTGPISF